MQVKTQSNACISLSDEFSKLIFSIIKPYMKKFYSKFFITFIFSLLLLFSHESLLF